MFARFHHPIRPKAIVRICILVNLGGDAAALSATLDDLVLKPTSASEIQQNQKQKAMPTEIKGDEESQEVNTSASMHKATQQSTKSN